MGMEQPIRVLHVVVNMNRGGAETLIMNLYRNIDREKVQFDFLVHKNQGHYEEEILKLGGKIHRISYITDVGHFGYIKELNKFFHNHSDYKIVHAHMDSMSGLVLEAARNSGIPVRISHSHNTQNEGNILGRIYKQYIKTKIIPNATDLIACSEEAAKWLFGKKSLIALKLKNGIEPQRLKYKNTIRNLKRAELSVGKRTLLLGHVGRFYSQKNHSYLIDLFAEFNRKYSNSMLLLIGEGPLRKEVEKKVKTLNLEGSVLFLGVRDDVADLMQAMDVLIFPSHHEGLPLTIIEAQASGLKCIVSEAIPKSTDIGANLITFLSLKDEVNKWVKAIRSSYTRQRKPEEYLKKSGYDITYTARKVQEHYISAINKLA